MSTDGRSLNQWHSLTRKVLALRRSLHNNLPLVGYLAQPVNADGGLPSPPWIHVDVGGRPDVADLLRVHVLEGPGLARTEWLIFRQVAPDLVLLTVELERPVRCSFAISFSLREHRDLLGAIVSHSGLSIGTFAPLTSSTGLLHAPGLFFPVVTEELRAALEDDAK